MNTAIRVVLIILGVMVGWWAVGALFGTLMVVLKFAIFAALIAGGIYLVSNVVAKKPLPWEKRSSLP